MTALFGPLVQKRTYVRLVYLLLALPLGTAYFAGLVGGISAGFGLVIVWVGVPILVALAVGWRVMAGFDRRLTISLLGASIDPPPPALPEAEGIWNRVKALIGDPFTWRSLSWLILRFPLGIVSFVTVVVLLSLAGAGLASPVVILLTERIELWPDYFIDRPVETWPLVLVGLVALVLAPHAINALAGIHSRGAEVLLSRSARERTRELEQRTTVLEERTRLAQELHDAVGHTITVTTLQAGAAGHVFEDDPEFARRALGDIEASGRRALGELDRILGILRDDEAGDRSPPPGIGRIGRLLHDVRGTGLPVEMSQAGSIGAVPDEVGRALYRILQEALTNVLKHAGAVQTAVTLAVGEDKVNLTVRNEAPTEPTPIEENSFGSGRGLVGVEERTTAYGGTLQHGPTPDGGYRLEVVLPFTVESSR